MYIKYLNYSKLIFSVLSFLLSGLFSSYFYCLYQNKGGGVLPGLFYTSATILVLLICKIDFKFKNLLVYSLLMNLTYVIAVSLTFISSYLGLLLGIAISGFGAVITFYLFNTFILNFEYNKKIVFILGALSFIVTEIIHFSFMSIYEKSPMGFIFNLEFSPNILLGEVFIFWHTSIGIYLFLKSDKSHH